MDDDKLRRWVATGIGHHQAGRLDEAERLYRRVLRRDATNPDALNFLGVLTFQRGDAETAIELLRGALKAQSPFPEAQNNLGRILAEVGRDAEAVDAFRAALRDRPELQEARFNLGVCLRKVGDAAGAIEELEAAIAAGGASAKACYQLALACWDAERADETCDALRKALELDPKLTRAYERLGVVLYALGRLDEAAEVYSRWLEVEPENVKARHLQSACSGMDVPERASDGYVAEIFDAFADSFDEKLAKLDYRAPALIAEAVAALGAPTAGADVLDAGCGTGLCGPLLRPYARTMVGVDLSGGMIEKAKALGVYDELVVDELGRFMAARPERFDLIVSADTLVYFGKLDAVLAIAARALRAGGALAFTIEALAGGNEPFVLQPHGRYAHSRAYVESSIAAAALVVRRLEPAVLRMENRAPVDGLLVLAERRR